MPRQSPSLGAVLPTGREPSETGSTRYSDGGQRLRSRLVPDLRLIVPEYFRGTDGQRFRLADFHYEILELLFQGGRLIVNLPTDHMKSTLGCFLFPLLSLMQDPNSSHIICGANINDSKRRVQAMELEIETNKALIQDFPWLARPERQGRIWAATQFVVAGRTENKPNPSVLATAIGASDIKGRRGKLLMDDIEGEEARWSPLKREQLHSFVKLEAWRCYEDTRESDRPLLCCMGTPFDVDSLYFRLESEGWKVVRKPAYTRTYQITRATDGDTQTRHDYLWPEKEKKVEDARRMLNAVEFAVAYLMDPTGGDASRLSSMQIQALMSEARFQSEQHSTFASLDPASGVKTRTADYAGIAVIRINWPTDDELPTVELMHAEDFRSGLFEQVHCLANLSARWNCPVIYEANSQQGNTYGDTFHHLHPEVKLIRHYTSHGNKFDTRMGLTVIKTLVRERKLKVPAGLLDAPGVKALVTEIRDLHPPFNEHNHIAAAIWFAVRHAYESVRHWKGPAIKSGYGPLSYRGSPYLAGRPAIVAYRGFGFGYGQSVGHDDLVRQEREKEETRFIEALRRGR